MLLAPPIVWSEVGQRTARSPEGRRWRRSSPACRRSRWPGSRLQTGARWACSSRSSLAERHRLSVYDATYLWLAIDIDGELATRDRALARAALAEEVPLYDGT